MSGYPHVLDVLPARSRSAVQVKWPAAVLLPSFGAVVFAVTLIEVLFIAQGPQGLFRDSDTGWHVRNGEAILQTWTIPRVDQFSYTRSGEPWFAWEWLSDAVFGAVHSFAGMSGVALLTALAIAVMAWGAARLALALGANLFLTAGGIVILLGTTGIHWLARPHVFSWLFALAFVAAAEHEQRGRTRSLYALPVVACLWANMHGSFLLGPAILFIYAVAGGFRNRFAFAALFSLLATLINPYGWRLHAHVLTYLQNDYLMDRISEFRSFSFHSPGAMYIELFLFGSIVGVLALFRQRAYAPALLGIAMLHLSLYSARHFPTAAVVLLPPILAALTREARKYSRLRTLLDYSDRLYGMDRRIWGIIPILVVLAASIAGLNTLSRSDAVGFDPAVFPVKAANFLQEKKLTARIFARDYWGGYLIYRFAGNTKVFIDGRSDFYGRQLLDAYTEIVEVKPSWNKVLNQYGAGLVLISPEHALASVLELSPQWRRIYSDSVATIFEKVG